MMDKLFTLPLLKLLDIEFDPKFNEFRHSDFFHSFKDTEFENMIGELYNDLYTEPKEYLEEDEICPSETYYYYNLFIE